MLVQYEVLVHLKDPLDLRTIVFRKIPVLGSDECDKTEVQNVIFSMYDPKCHIFVSINKVFLRCLDINATVLIVVLGLRFCVFQGMQKG